MWTKYLLQQLEHKRMLYQVYEHRTPVEEIPYAHVACVMVDEILAWRAPIAGVVSRAGVNGIACFAKFVSCE